MIHLRDIQEKDAALICHWKNDDVLKLMALEYDYTTSCAEQLRDIKNALDDPDQEYKIIVLHRRSDIGYIRINWMDVAKRIAWLRFALGEERGHGYSEMALRKYLTGLKENGCLRIEAEVYSNNRASQRVLEKLGFLKEGIKREAHRTAGGYIDVIVYGLLMKEMK